MSVDICLYLWNHHHNRGNKYIYCLPEFPCALLVFDLILVCGMLKMRSTFLTHLFLFFFLIEFIGVILVNKLIQVSGAQFYNTASEHCVVCSPLPPAQVKSQPITIYLSSTFLYLRPHLGDHHTVVHVHEFFPFSLLLNPSTPYTQPHPTAVSLLSIYESVSLLLVSSVCSLDSTYEWNHMVFVFLWLA